MKFKTINFIYGLMIVGFFGFPVAHSTVKKKSLSCSTLFFGQPISDFKPVKIKELGFEFDELRTQHANQVSFDYSAEQNQISINKSQEKYTNPTLLYEISGDFIKSKDMSQGKKTVSINTVLEQYIDRGVLSRLFKNEPQVFLSSDAAHRLKIALDWFVGYIQKISTLEVGVEELLLDIIKRGSFVDLVVLNEMRKKRIVTDVFNQNLRTLSPFLAKAIPEPVKYPHTFKLLSALELARTKKKYSGEIENNMMRAIQYIQQSEKFRQNIEWLARYMESDPGLKKERKSTLFKIVMFGWFEYLLEVDFSN